MKLKFKQGIGYPVELKVGKFFLLFHKVIFYLPFPGLVKKVRLKSWNLLASKTYYWFLPKNSDNNYVTELFFDIDLHFYDIN